ncbi:Transducin/WD40 repeat-like superfamily protein [Striga hermonthica]|uniref:Transducin/WD40 repeat-like superfamily protein n=1 Tax=Striga hermonthica TaxID=68872 RepID=A0A9N7R720_STRHE|nr:Transducin/WD40 repeat-like superfamily protein [Striga hermonthica]
MSSIQDDFQSWLPNTTSNFNPTTSSSSDSPSLSSLSHELDTLSGDQSFDNIKFHSTVSSSSRKPPPFTVSSVKTDTSQISFLAARGPILYAATTREVSLYDPRTLTLVGSLGPSSALARSIAFGRRHRIFTAHLDRKIRVWRRSTADHRRHRLVSTLPTLQDRIFRCLIPGSYVQVRRHERRLWVEHADAVSSLAVDDSSGLVYSASWDRSFKTWDGLRCVGTVRAHVDAVNTVVVGPAGRTVYTGSADGQIRVWSAVGKRHHRLVATLEKHESSVNALTLTGDGSGFCSGGGDGLIIVWERENEHDDEDTCEFFVACWLKGHKGAVLCLAQAKGVLISGSSDRTVRVWGIRPGGYKGCLVILEGHVKPVKSLVAVPDDEEDMNLDEGLSVYSGSLDGEIRAWKISTISSLIGCD